MNTIKESLIKIFSIRNKRFTYIGSTLNSPTLNFNKNTFATTHNFYHTNCIDTVYKVIRSYRVDHLAHTKRLKNLYKGYQDSVNFKTGVYLLF